MFLDTFKGKTLSQLAFASRSSHPRIAKTNFYLV